MGVYVSLPATARSDQLEELIASALSYVASQPPKIPKPVKTPKS